jgi:hypothetical protein
MKRWEYSLQARAVAFVALLSLLNPYGAIAQVNVGTSGLSAGNLLMESANVLAMRSGTTGQCFYVYNTFTSATNYERIENCWNTNIAILGARAGSGGGNFRATRLYGSTVSIYTGATDAAATPGLVVSNAQAVSTVGTFTSSRATDLGWTVVAGANTACNTTCTSACVFGMDSAAAVPLLCTDATADNCLCAGSS